MNAQYRVNLLFVRVLLGVGGCGGRDGPSPVAKYFDLLESKPYQVRMVRELGEYQVAQIVDKAAGVSMDVYGAKHADGVVTSIDQTIRTDSAGAKTVIEYLPDGSKRIEGGDLRIYASPHASGKWLIAITDLKTGASFQTSVDGVNPVANPTAIPRLLAQSESVAPNPNQVIANVSTSNCGQPGDMLAGVRVLFRDGLGKVLGDYLASKTATGQYRAAIPDAGKEGPITLKFLRTLLEGLNAAADTACTLDQEESLDVRGILRSSIAITGQESAHSPALASITKLVHRGCRANERGLRDQGGRQSAADRDRRRCRGRVNANTGILAARSAA